MTGSEGLQSAAQTLSDIFSSVTSGSRKPENTFDYEMKSYLGTPRVDSGVSPLEWWRSSGSQLYPKLARLARKYLGLCATSVTSERLFSVAGNIVTSKRTRLTPDNVNKLVFLACNASGGSKKETEEFSDDSEDEL